MVARVDYLITSQSRYHPYPHLTNRETGPEGLGIAWEHQRKSQDTNLGLGSPFSAAPRSCLEMHILRPGSRPIESSGYEPVCQQTLRGTVWPADI